MAHSRMLAKLGLDRNPFVDRTAEKTNLNDGSFYLHSDLQGFSPSKTTYIFFGRRGSGKTTIRLMMMQRHFEYNETRALANKSELLLVDLCRPGRMGDCLKFFMNSIGADNDNWDAKFCEEWTSNDLADCVVSFAVNDLVRHVIDETGHGKRIMEHLQLKPRVASQFLLLCQLYAQEDSTTLLRLRKSLMPSRTTSILKSKWTWFVIATTGLGGLALAALGQDAQLSAKVHDAVSDHVPVEYLRYPKTTILTGLVSVYSLVRFFKNRSRTHHFDRAAELCEPLRVAEPRVDMMESLLNQLFSHDDTAEVIRRLFIGSTAQQKLEYLSVLAKEIGFEDVAVFGDCFDEVNLLDPLAYPASLKTFAREVCRNEILNIGRLHFFFPDARASLDLSTDRVVREARFDRHFVRDLTWSRFQLEDLAERRFNSAQQLKANAQDSTGKASDGTSFQSLFQHVSREDFSAAISKLHTPRELMVFMTELMARIEAHAADGAMVAAQDMEIAVTKAQEQSV